MNDKKQLKVSAIKCPLCEDILFSRSRHDCRRCTCGEVYVDGGFDYSRVGFMSKKPELFVLEINQTKKELYDDWNLNKDKFGLISKKENK